MIKKWQRRRVCDSKHYATLLQDEEDAIAKKTAKTGHTPEATTSNSKTKALWKDPPAGNQNPVVGKKRKSPNNKTFLNPKQTKETSNSEVRPLTMVDIPDIVAAVVDANQHKKTAQVRTSRHTLRSDNRTS